MATRVLIHGRTYFEDREFGELRLQAGLSRKSFPKDRNGEPVDSAASVAADDPRSPYRAGIPYEDVEENVVYRRVRSVNPLEGWATTEFWQDRWRCRHTDVLDLVRRGLIDAAIPEGSQVRRYRCRDERAVMLSPVMRSAERRRQSYLDRFKGKRSYDRET